MFKEHWLLPLKKSSKSPTIPVCLSESWHHLHASLLFVLFWSTNLDVQWEDRWKAPVVLICDPKYVWFSSVFSLGIKTHACDEFSHFLLAIKLMNYWWVWELYLKILFSNSATFWDFKIVFFCKHYITFCQMKGKTIFLAYPVVIYFQSTSFVPWNVWE